MKLLEWAGRVPIGMAESGGRPLRNTSSVPVSLSGTPAKGGGPLPVRCLSLHPTPDRTCEQRYSRRPSSQRSSLVSHTLSISHQCIEHSSGGRFIRILGSILTPIVANSAAAFSASPGFWMSRAPEPTAIAYEMLGATGGTGALRNSADVVCQKVEFDATARTDRLSELVDLIGLSSECFEKAAYVTRFAADPPCSRCIDTHGSPVGDNG